VIEPVRFARTIEEIEELVRRFEACTLPRERWTHEAHLTVALTYLCRYPQPDATELIRVGIKRYNEAHGVRQTPEGGYHETITRFFIWAISRVIAEAGPATPLPALFEGMMARLGDRELPLEYWSKSRLMSWEARTNWVDPDLKPLDGLPRFAAGP
jgi:hypothetical protein